MSTLSVVICTFNRELTLRQTLTDVLEQERPPDQIVVVDQTGVHEPETEQLLASSKLTVVKTTEANLPAARNLGISRATGNIVLFVDDDVRLKRDLIRRLEQEFRSPHVDGIAPCVVSVTEPASANFIRQRSSVRSAEGKRRVRSVIGACMAFRRAAILDVGGFDRFMGVLNRSASGEDLEFTRRFSARGYGLWLQPALGVVHLDVTPGGCEVRIGHGAGKRIQHQRALAYIVLKEENSVVTRTPRAYLRLLRTFLLRRDRLSPMAWVPALKEMNQVMRELQDSLRAEAAVE